MEMNRIKTALDNVDVNNISQEQLYKIVEALSGREMEIEINKRQQEIEEAVTINIQSETKLAGLREQYTGVLKEYQAIGADPKNVNLELLNLCKSIIDTTLKMDDCMPDIEAIKNLQKSNNQQNNVGF